MVDCNSQSNKTDEDQELTVYGVIVQSLKQVGETGVSCVIKLWEVIKFVFGCLKEAISFGFETVRDAVGEMYSGVQKVSYLFEKASGLEQNVLIAVAYKINKMINGALTQGKEILEFCRVISKAICGGNIDDLIEYVNNITREDKNQCPLQEDTKNNESLNIKTLELLSISNFISEKLGKTRLTDVINLFEVLSNIVKDEYKKKIDVYSKMVQAARCAAGKEIDLDVFNHTLGIKGNPTDHYWVEAMESIIEPRLVYKINDAVEKIANPNNILLLPLAKPDESSTEGVYILIGVEGAGQINANQLVKVLKDNTFDLSTHLVTKETTSMVMIQTKDLTLTAIQELEDDTSIGMLMVMKTEVY